MSFRGTGQGKEQLGTLSPGDLHRERVNELPGFTFFLSPERKCSSQLGLDVGKTNPRGPSCQVDWELKRDAECSVFCSLFVEFSVREPVGYGAGREVSGL